MMEHVISNLSWLVMALIFCFIISAYGDCDSPPSISYGMLKEEFANQETFNPGDTVQYNCRPGFIRILGTRNSITCMSNSEWTKHDTFCTDTSPSQQPFPLRSCGNPGDMENGYFEASNFLFGAKVTYYCDYGYKMISSRNYRFCQEDGTWTNAVPECEAVICPPPISIPNGLYYPEKDEYIYMDVVVYQCNNPKTVLEGEAFVVCTKNRTWSSSSPKCIDVECPSPEVPDAKKVSGFSVEYTRNSAVRFECFEGFIMNGTSDIKCNIHSQWEPSLPTCERNFCYAPQLINGRIKTGEPKHFNNEKGFHINDSVEMDCNFLFVLNGQSAIACHEDLNWHPEVPICEKRFGCSSPKILNGRVVLKNGDYYFPEKDGHAFSTSDKILVECDEGFELAGGSGSSKCKYSFRSLSYKWSPKLPTCERSGASRGLVM